MAVTEARPAPAPPPEPERDHPGGWLGQFYRAYPAMSVPAFRAAWSGVIPALTGQGMNMTATGFAAFSLTGSAGATGLINFTSGIPSLLLTLVGGVVADRWPRRHVLMWTQVALFSTATTLAILNFTGRLEYWHLFFTSLVQFASVSFNAPARQTLMTEAAGPRYMRSGVALATAGINITRVVGPSVAGAMLSVPFIGLAGVYVTIAMLYATTFWSLHSLRDMPTLSGEGKKGTSTRANGWESLKEGLSYVWSTPTLRLLTLTNFVPALLSMPIQGLMPAYSERVHHAGAAGLGLLSASLGAGALLGSLGSAALSHESRRPLMTQFAVGLAMGVALGLFALAPNLFLAVPALIAVGFCQSAFNTLSSGQAMVLTEPRLHGRVMSVRMSTMFMIPLAGFPLGWLADQIGDRTMFLGCGAGVIVILGAVMLLSPLVREERAGLA
jgi:MFS family permease